MNFSEFHIPMFLTTIIITFIASGGFWNYLINRKKKPDAITKLLMGLAHTKIISIGAEHIELGSISSELYRDLVYYLYEPYLELGGNGACERIMVQVAKLPIN